MSAHLELLDQIEHDLDEARDNVLESVDETDTFSGVRADAILYALGHVHKAKLVVRELREDLKDDEPDEGSGKIRDMATALARSNGRSAAQ